MLTPCFIMNMIEVEGDQRKHQSAVKNRSVLWTAIAFVVLKTGPIHQVLLGLMAGHQTKM